MKRLIERISRRNESLQLRLKKKAVRFFMQKPQTRAVFVVGNQRSGTTMLLRHLNRHMDFDVYHEDSRAMTDWRIRDLGYIKKLIDSSRAKIIVFKPLEDSHRALEFLEQFTDSQAIWLFRHFADVVNSSMEHKWGKHCREYIRKICNEEYFAYSEPLNLSETNVKLIKDLYEPDITPETCIALIWYLRNTIYFDCKMQNNPEILLVCYEVLVSNPAEQLARIMKFIGFPDALSVVKSIHAKSIRKRPAPPIRNDVKELCETFYQEFLTRTNRKRSQKSE